MTRSPYWPLHTISHGDTETTVCMVPLLGRPEKRGLGMERRERGESITLCGNSPILLGVIRKPGLLPWGEVLHLSPHVRCTQRLGICWLPGYTTGRASVRDKALVGSRQQKSCEVSSTTELALGAFEGLLTAWTAGWARPVGSREWVSSILYFLLFYKDFKSC